MVAGLLYVIGLIAVVATLVLVGLEVPQILEIYNRGMAATTPDVFAMAGEVTRALGWTGTPLVGGLVLMALGRIVMLLAAINRALRGNA